ncbi:MAG TPA: hypothetical protein VFQ61_05830 [Polyangiaceae bacterium]|nr:hypothetical protein [Polyangiaceae bacterium]
MTAATRVNGSGSRFGPWLFGARVDLAVFTGSALVALLLSAAASALGVTEVSDWAWLALVLAIDVAHVHATWFRTYFDVSELRRHPARYALVPLLAYIGGVCAYRAGMFWRVVAYLAVFHFVRQQVGWVALYRARAGLRGSLERCVDEAAVYAATLYPLIVWHARSSEKHFSWLSPGDFVALDLERILPASTVLWALALASFFARELRRLWLGQAMAVGRVLLVLSTAVTWYVGIVVNESDFVFTATNVIPHGVPYVWFLFAYTRERREQAPAPAALRVAGQSVAAFVCALWVLAWVEEWAWDRWVDHDRVWLFGGHTAGEGPLTQWIAWLVPLLALPQVTHYLLDGLLWRRGARAEKSALQRALGFGAHAGGAPSRVVDLAAGAGTDAGGAHEGYAGRVGGVHS